MTNDEAIAELKLIVSLFSKAGYQPRRPDTELPKAKGDRDKLQDVVDYLRVCVKYSVWDLECMNRERGELCKQAKRLRKQIKELGGTPIE